MSGNDAVNAQLPPGWLAASFSDVAKARMGPTILAKDLSESGLPVYSAGKANTAWGFTKRDVPVFPNGTIVVSARGSIGFPKIPKEPSFTSTQTTIAITPSPAIGSTYLQRFLQSSDWAEMSSGAAIPMLTISMLGELAVPLAPLAEQKRIADKLEAVLGRVDACRARLDRVPALLKRFRESVLSAAASGQITDGWRLNRPKIKGVGANQPKMFEDPVESPFQSLPHGWQIQRSAAVVQDGADIVYGIVQPGAKLSQGVPYIRGTDIQNGRILTDQLLKTSRVIADRYARSALKGGDILLGIIRATKVALVPDELEGANITQGTARFRPSSALRSKFLAIVLESPSVQRWLHAHYRGIDMPGLNLADVRRIPIPIPPIDEQDEIVRRVEDLFAFAARIEARLATAQKTVERLTPATLAKAFRGELVPQDPNDEPASVLLERLHATAPANHEKKRKPKGQKR